MWKFPIPWRSNGTPTINLFCHIWVILLKCGVMENVFITGVVKRGNSQYIPNVSNKGGYTLSNKVVQWGIYQPTPPMQHCIIFFLNGHPLPPICQRHTCYPLWTFPFPATLPILSKTATKKTICVFFFETKIRFQWFLIVSMVPELYRKLRNACRKSFPTSWHHLRWSAPKLTAESNYKPVGHDWPRMYWL